MNNNDKAREQVLAMIKSNGGYTPIPDIFLKLKLKPTQLLLLSVAHRYSQSGKIYKASYNDLKENYGIARMTAINNINSLIKAGLLIKNSGDSTTDNSYSVDYNTINKRLTDQSKNDTSTKNSLVQNLDYPSTKNVLASTKIRPQVVQKLDPYNTIYNTSYNTSNKKEEVEEENPSSSSLSFQSEQEGNTKSNDDTQNQSTANTSEQEHNSQPKQLEQAGNKKKPVRSQKKKTENTRFTKADYEKMVDGYTDNADLKAALLAHYDMRLNKKKEISTEYTAKLLFKKLDKLSISDEEKITIVDNAIVGGWQGFFPLDDKPAKDKQAEPTRISPTLAKPCKRQEAKMDKWLEEALANSKKQAKTSQRADSTVLNPN